MESVKILKPITPVRNIQPHRNPKIGLSIVLCLLIAAEFTDHHVKVKEKLVPQFVADKQVKQRHFIFYTLRHLIAILQRDAEHSVFIRIGEENISAMVCAGLIS